MNHFNYYVSKVMAKVRVEGGATVAVEAKAMIKAGGRPFPLLSHTLWARCLGPAQVSQLACWAAGHVSDIRGCFVALLEGSGRVEGCLVSLRRVTALHVHYPAKSRIVDFLVCKSLDARALIRSIARGLKANPHVHWRAAPLLSPGACEKFLNPISARSLSVQRRDL